MILQALTSYYEHLADLGKVGRPGWSIEKVSYAIELNDDGTIDGIYPLLDEVQDKKKTKWVPRKMLVPKPVKRSVNVSANFLCDNAKYILGIDPSAELEADEKKREKAKKRAIECFEACQSLHKTVLADVSSPAAEALCRFFEIWQPEEAQQDSEVAEYWEKITDGSNLIFWYDGESVTEDSAVRGAWQRHYDTEKEGSPMRCLITGEPAIPQAIHPAIKGVPGAQSSGAALVSFNEKAFESYDRKQNINAPIGSYAAFAYTTALNYLISDYEHRTTMGDTMLLCWPQSGEEAYQEAVMGVLSGGEAEDQSTIRSVLDKLSHGELAEWNETMLSPNMQFFVLGISPNAARLSVRFFLQNTFGKMMENLNEHYFRLTIQKPSFERYELLPLWKLMKETVNQNSRDKSPSPQLSGEMLRAILCGTRYPATLINAITLRIRAEHDISYAKAAMIKAYYMKNKTEKCPEEVLTVALNETSNNTPYVLGRMFSLLEQIQETALPGINATIRDKYFTSASATPAAIFPNLINLAQKHLRKLEQGQRIYLDSQLSELMGKLEEGFPARMILPEQGAFQLGYYHQTQKRFTKKGE